MEMKDILVLARNDHREAMRVAAGLTIFGHNVDLVFMGHPVSQEDAESEQADLLELAEIVPKTTIAEMSEHFSVLTSPELGTALKTADVVMSI